MEKYVVSRRIKQVATESGYDAEGFAEVLELKKADKLRKILNVEQRPDLDIIERILKKFPLLRAEWLLRGNGNMFATHAIDDQQAAIETDELALQPVTIDTANNPVIPIINRKASAGYASNYQNPTWFESLEAITHPHLNDGDYFCLQVSGDSMHPTLYEDDYLIARRLNNYGTEIRDNHVYVVVTYDGVMVKRVENQLSSRGEIIIRSDNRFYSPQTIPEHDILEVWEARLRLSGKLPNTAEDVQSRLDQLELDMQSLKNNLKPSM